jgi:hypothetical protein
MTDIQPLQRIQGIERFRSEFFDTKVPVVVEGASRAMPAFDKWTLAYLESQLGDMKLMIRFSQASGTTPAHIDGTAFFRYLEDPERFKSSKGPAYLADYHIEPPFGDEVRARLSEDVFFPLARRDETWAEWNTIYLGPPDSYTALHQDTWNTTTWMSELEGLKVWRLCAPEDMDTARAATLNPFEAETLPCTFYEARLERGDTIFVPPGWWHAVRNETRTLAISGNYCTLAQARVALQGVPDLKPESLREVWHNTWTAVIERAEQKLARNNSSG